METQRASHFEGHVLTLWEESTQADSIFPVGHIWLPLEMVTIAAWVGGALLTHFPACSQEILNSWSGTPACILGPTMLLKWAMTIMCLTLSYL